MVRLLSRFGREIRYGCLLAALLATPVTLTAATTRIKLATLVPTGSVYHKSLLNLREEWRRLSGGSVELVIYADGKLGGDAQVVRLMGLNSVQAAMFTAVGLSEIDRSVEGLQSIPMGFRTLDEVDHIGNQLQPILDDRLEKKGFRVLAWSDAGWVRFFTKKPVSTPSDLKALKLFTWAGSPDLVGIYKASGFNPVPIETADIVPSLETGLIEAVPCPPVFALAAQIDRRAPYMLDLDWAPLVGAIVIRKATWESFSPSIREPLLKAAQKTAQEIRTKSREESAGAVQAMQNRGLQVTRLTPAELQAWRSAAEAAYPELRGKLVPEDIFDKVMGFLREYRKEAR